TRPFPSCEPDGRADDGLGSLLRPLARRPVSDVPGAAPPPPRPLLAGVEDLDDLAPRGRRSGAEGHRGLLLEGARRADGSRDGRALAGGEAPAGRALPLDDARHAVDDPGPRA